MVKEFKLTVDRVTTDEYLAIAKWKNQQYQYKSDDDILALINVRHAVTFSHGKVTFTGPGEGLYQEWLKEKGITE